MTDPADDAAALARQIHRYIGDGQCSTKVPCRVCAGITKQLIDALRTARAQAEKELDALKAEVERLQREKYGTPCSCETWIETLRQTEEEIPGKLAEAREQGRLRGIKETEDWMRGEAKRVEEEVSEFGRPIASDGDHHEVRDWMSDLWEQGRLQGTREVSEKVIAETETFACKAHGWSTCDCRAELEKAIRALLAQEQVK